MQTKVLEKLQRFASEPRGQIVLVILTLAVALLVRLLLFRVQGYGGDIGTFGVWYNTAAEKGFHGFYDTLAALNKGVWTCDYPRSAYISSGCLERYHMP